MSRFHDAVRRVKNTVRRVKNMCTMNNVYDCARPILLLLGLAGVGATSIRNTDGVYTLHNTKYTTFITFLMSVIYAPSQIIKGLYHMLQNEWNFEFSIVIYYIISTLTSCILLFTVNIGGIMTHVSCKRLGRVLQIIHNVDSQLEEVDIRVRHWPITLKVALLAPVIFHYTALLTCLRVVKENGDYEYLLWALCYIIFYFFVLWVMLFVLIIHERFVCLTKVLQQDASVTTVQVVGERARGDNYRLRRVQLARHVHEQLTEAVQLFSDSCRYAVMAMLAYSMLNIIRRAFWQLVYQRLSMLYDGYTAALTILVLTSICQANKNERRVRTARIRHLLAFETDREIIQQLQQYTMYNAFSPPGLIDFQFSDINNVLLFVIIDVVVSNILIIYSYTR